ncbi:hypothetical protein ACFLV3_02540 [Chloroflexota bacterium]
MKKILFIICVIGFVTLGGACFYLKMQIDIARNDILNLTSVVNLQEVKITEKESELNITTSQLKVTESRLVFASTEWNKALELNEALEGELVGTKRELDYVERDLQREKTKTHELQNELEAIQDELEEIREELQLYHDTGITVGQGIVLPYRTNYYGSFDLGNNPDATNTSWSQLMDFLREDRTDNIPYVENVYTCGEFAETLHNNAENIGIKAAWVAIQFEDNSMPHALNAFVTIDRGLVYIDSTGVKLGSTKPRHMDRIVTITVGKRVSEKLLFAPGWEMLPTTLKVARVEIYW